MGGHGLERILTAPALALVLSIAGAMASPVGNPGMPGPATSATVDPKTPDPKATDPKTLGLKTLDLKTLDPKTPALANAGDTVTSPTPTATATPDSASTPPPSSSPTPAPAAATAPPTPPTPGIEPGSVTESTPTGTPPAPVMATPSQPGAPAPAAKQDPSPGPTSPTSPQSVTTAAPTVEGVPVTEPAELPPPTVKDIAPLPTLSAADLAIGEKLRDLVTGKYFGRLVDRKNERTAIEAFYVARSFAPLWIDNGEPNGRAKAAIARLKAADTDGLDPADYAAPDFAAAAGRSDALAEAEIKLTLVVLTYARHAQIGQVHYSRISADIHYEQAAPDPAAVLAKVAQAKDVAEALGSYNPPQAGYLALKAKLAEARAHDGDTDSPRIGSGPLLKVGMQDPRVPALRERLGLSGDSGSATYDKALAEAVKKFQRQHELTASGNLNGATIDALDGPRRDHIADVIIANMERWRWMPRDLGNPYVMVNLADFTLKVVKDGSLVWSTRIVDGKPSTPTPLLSESMKYITINPTWNVPPSIVNNEYLPVLRQDPTALERIGLMVEQNRDGTIHIFQPPGERNALGRIRFNFPNKFLVYQHDTPDKYLFEKDKRAYSHGCMRVQYPDKYAEVLLSLTQPKDGYTLERIHKLYGTGERDIQLAVHIPVHLTYQTAFVDENGKLQIREDIYGRDARIVAVLKGDERKVADIAVERRETTTRPEAFRLPPREDPFGGASFFQRLFR